MLSSSADSLAIYLSPGVRSYTPEQIHFLVAHEIGHCVHRRVLPDGDTRGWSEWAGLRGVGNSAVYHASAPHADRPHEIFAEDFRVLFGGALARGDGSIENREIESPESIPGLREYYLGLPVQPTTPVVAVAVALANWTVGPNPVRPGDPLILSLPPDQMELAEKAAARRPEVLLVDLGGRVVDRLSAASASAGQWQLAFDGRDAAGRELTSGAYWLRIESGPGPSGTATLPLRVIR